MRVCRRCHKLKDPRFFVKTTLHSIKTLKQCSSCRLQRSSSEKRKRIVSRSSNNIAVKKSKVNPSYRIESRCGARIKSWLGRKSIRVSQVQYELAFRLYTVSPQLIDFLGVSTLAHVSNKLDSEREILQLNWEDCHIDHIVPLAAFNQNKGAILFAIILNVSCVSGRGACQSSITCYKPASTFCS